MAHQRESDRRPGSRPHRIPRHQPRLLPDARREAATGPGNRRSGRGARVRADGRHQRRALAELLRRRPESAREDPPPRQRSLRDRRRAPARVPPSRPYGRARRRRLCLGRLSRRSLPEARPQHSFLARPHRTARQGPDGRRGASPHRLAGGEPAPRSPERLPARAALDGHVAALAGIAGRQCPLDAARPARGGLAHRPHRRGQHRQPPRGARLDPAARDRRAHRAWSEPRPHRPPTGGRGDAPRPCRRARRRHRGRGHAGRGPEIRAGRDSPARRGLCRPGRARFRAAAFPRHRRRGGGGAGDALGQSRSGDGHPRGVAGIGTWHPDLAAAQRAHRRGDLAGGRAHDLGRPALAHLLEPLAREPGLQPRQRRHRQRLAAGAE